MQPPVDGRITIAPSVLTTIVRQTALEQISVSRLAASPPSLRGLFSGGASEEGIAVAITAQGVQVEVHVVAEADANMLDLGTSVQLAVTRALEEMVGMPVSTVDVFIDEVALPNRAI